MTAFVQHETSPGIPRRILYFARADASFPPSNQLQEGLRPIKKTGRSRCLHRNPLAVHLQAIGLLVQTDPIVQPEVNAPLTGVLHQCRQGSNLPFQRFRQRIGIGSISPDFGGESDREISFSGDGSGRQGKHDRLGRCNPRHQQRQNKERQSSHSGKVFSSNKTDKKVMKHMRFESSLAPA